MSFELAYQETLGHEGGYANDPKDRGGETYKGISRNNFPNWEGWKIIDTASAKTNNVLSKIPELQEAVQAFYRQEFWNKLKCDQISLIDHLVAAELFDSAINCGHSRGIKFLQQALNVLNNNQKLWPDITPDGIIGDRTIEHVRLCCKSPIGRKLLLKCQNGEQYMFYRSLKQHELYRGWFNRT